jgi:transposase-like protein
VRNPFREVLDVDFHESVAREHLKQGMPVIELHRNHGVPLSAVKSWIKLYREGGRSALRKNASRLAVTLQRAPTHAELQKLRMALESEDSDEVQKALILIAVRNIQALIPNVETALKTKSATIDAILTLKALGATQQLKSAKKKFPNYAAWFGT